MNRAVFINCKFTLRLVSPLADALVHRVRNATQRSTLLSFFLPTDCVNIFRSLALEQWPDKYFPTPDVLSVNQHQAGKGRGANSRAHAKTAVTYEKLKPVASLKAFWQKPSTLEIWRVDPHLERYRTARPLLVGNGPSGSVVPPVQTLMARALLNAEASLWPCVCLPLLEGPFLNMLPARC